MTRRVVIAAVLANCLTALLVALIAYVLVAHDARSSEDRVLKAAAAHPAGTLGSRTTYSELAQLSAPDGRVIRQTAALSALGTLGVPLRHGFTNLELGHHHLRVYTVRIRRRAFLSVAVSDAPARASLRRLRLDVAIAVIAAALIVSVVLVLITRRALAPVRQTAAVADRIVTTGDLTARVPEPTGHDEIAQLSTSINRMLAHLQSSDAALRRLVADASHELRSPVTTLRGNLELLSDGRLGPEDRAEALADTRAEADRLGALVEELLTLARADTVDTGEGVALAQLIPEALSGTGARFRPPGRTLAEAEVAGDAVALRAMIRNLAENADRYAGGAEVSLHGDDGSLVLTVVDHGPGVPRSEQDSVFARFHRGANAAGQPGSGLGLAIVAATARSHGGQVQLTDTPGGGATFRVSLPRR